MTSPSLLILRTQSDERLVELARGGHERAFEAIVERYRRPLLRACRRVLPEARAEDALQQALVAAWAALERGDEVRDLRAWLYRIAHNTALNQLRMSGYDYAELRDALVARDAPADQAERRVVVRQTLAGLAALPARQRDALLRIAVEGRPQDEVARDLGVSEGAVRQLVHRARVSLRAAATVLVPMPLAGWAAAAGGGGAPAAERIAELAGGAGGAGVAGLLAKAGAVAVLAGGAVAGPALIHDDHGRGAARAGDAEAATPPRTPASAKAVTAAPGPGAARDDRTPASDSRGRRLGGDRAAAGRGGRGGGGGRVSGRAERGEGRGGGSGDDDAGRFGGDRAGRVGDDRTGDDRLSTGTRSGPSGDDGLTRSGDDLSTRSGGDRSGPSGDDRAPTSGTSGGGTSGQSASGAPVTALDGGGLSGEGTSGARTETEGAGSSEGSRTSGSGSGTPGG